MDTATARQLAALTERAGGEDEAAAVELAERFADLSAAAEVLTDAGEPHLALTLVGNVGRFCQDNGLVTEGRILAETVLARAGTAGEPATRARAWLVLGELAFRQGDQAVARSATLTAREAAREAGDTRLEHGTEFNLSRIGFRDGDAPTIRRHAERMVELAGDDARLRYGAVHMLAWAAHTEGDVATAIDLFEQNVANARAADHPIGEAGELLNLGALALDRGDTVRAARHLAEGLEISARLGSTYLLPGALTDIGRLAILRGDPEAGLELVAAGDAQYRAAGLIPDPGDDAQEAQRAAATAAVGPGRAAELAAAGAARSLEDAIDLARRVLRR